jgi:hypothetical protein
MREKYTTEQLEARLKFFLGLTLGAILLFTTMGILYALVFVTQPLGSVSENDKMFFNVLSSVATFITGTLAGILIGRDGSKDIMAAQIANKETDAKNMQSDKKLEAEIDATAARLAAKPDGQVPEPQPIDTDWDK